MGHLPFETKFTIAAVVVLASSVKVAVSDSVVLQSRSECAVCNLNRDGIPYVLQQPRTRANWSLVQLGAPEQYGAQVNYVPQGPTMTVTGVE